MTTAIVLGTAASVFDDLNAALALFTPDIVIAVNDVGVDYEGHIDHWASCHIDLFPWWIQEREAKGYEPVDQLWTNESKIRHLSAAQRAMNFLGAPYSETSSGGLGLSVAQVQQCSHIVLCGLPLENGPHYKGEHDFTFEGHYQARWLAVKDSMANVRSMSGWTREQLGAPTKSWLPKGKKPVQEAEPVVEPDE